MNGDFTWLRDPGNGTRLAREDDALRSESGVMYPIVRGIPRFVGAENYSADFGDQWNRFPQTQLDSHTGIALSEARLERCLRCNLESLAGKTVLEAGSGAGRFTEVLLKYGAHVHSLDYSTAVDANAANNGRHDNFLLVQADIRRIPFPKAAYDYVICLGVLQHTPNPEESIRCLWEMVRPGGGLVVDHYRSTLGTILPPPFGTAEVVYRQFIKRLPRRIRFDVVKAVVDFWFPWHWRFRSSVFAQRMLRRISPVHFYYPALALRDRQMYYEWALLDTHDGTTDVYKHHRTPAQIRVILEGIGGSEIAVEVGGNGVEAFCRKPICPGPV